MRRPPPSAGLLRFLFPAMCLFILASGLLFVGGKSEPGALMIATLGIGFLLALFGWIMYTREVARPARALVVFQLRIKDGLAGLSSNLAKLTTGDLKAEAPAVSPSAIAIHGHLGKVARLAASSAELLRESIEAFNGITSEPCRRLCYVGSDSYAEGRIAGEALGRILSGRGRVAIILSDLHAVNYILRRKGAMSVLAERFPAIEVVETIENFEVGEKTYSSSLDLMRRYRDLGAIYMAEGNTPSYAAKAVMDAGRSGKTFVVAHDLTDETMEHVINGGISTTISQDPFAQGHDSVIRLFNHVAAGWTPSTPRFLTTLQEVRRDNYRSYWNPATALGAGDPARLAKIAEPSDRGRAGFGAKRIAIVCISGEKFWKPVHEGALEAKRELEIYGARVEWIVPPRAEDLAPTAASNFAPIIERLIAEKWDGMAIPIFDRNLVPLLNRAAQNGIAVVTYNSEPTSLREMITAVSTHTGDLLALSQELAASAEESGQSTASIAATIGKITSSLRSQASETG